MDSGDPDLGQTGEETLGGGRGEMESIFQAICAWVLRALTSSVFLKESLLKVFPPICAHLSSSLPCFIEVGQSQTLYAF